jgi:hypothetical protein
MDASSAVILIYGLFSIGVAITAHWRSKNYLLASGVTALMAGIGFQIFNYFLIGYLDPFFLIGFATTTSAAFLIALVVGLPFIYSRAKRTPHAVHRQTG